ncbi:hypothetical protein Pyn_21352 [Prunus yedoensis var. nudiflora]|uniref:Uncharacterized protein n=1 Tax=Prunus yedoensis var. nudiflora TaxID=2094558 RepID=A0A314YUJ5_PRUYE|nr:hypothetical protein Pyn_21352 [Prunus yedoensis var. nudiflora]
MEKQQASIDGVQKEHKLNVVKDVFFQGRRTIGYELNYVPSQSYFAGKIYFVNGKERDARFLKFKKSEEALAKKIFTQTSKLKFDQLLSEMVDDEDPAIPLRTNNPDRLIRWWRNVIRNLLRAVKHIHFHDLFHMGLEDTRNYVVVSNGIKIINVQNSLEDLDDPVYPEQVNSWRIKDLKALRNMLKKNILLPGYDSWLDRNYFFDFFDNEDYEYCAYVKQLKNHPFLLTHAERRRWFVEIRLLVNESELNRILDDRAFDEYRDWNWFKDKAPRIQRIYKDPNNKYDGKSVRDLVEFLKDVYLDGEEAADTEVRRSYMKFLNQIYTFI